LGAFFRIVVADTLQDQGISVGDINKLKAVGITTLGGVMRMTRKALLDVKGLSDAKVEKIVASCKKLDPHSTGFKSGKECLAHRAGVTKLSTGSKELDKLLGGGIETMSITEVFGEFRTGKTQLAHTLCVTAQLPTELGGGNGKVAFIDTEGTFRPERIVPIAERYGVDADAALDNIVVARALTSDHQAELINEIAARFHEDHYKLLVVDSITALFRVDYSGRGELAERQQKLARMLSSLIKVAEEFNVAVFISNQVVSDPGAAMSFVADPKKPVGGNILGHASTTRLSLRKGRGNERICKIYDSPMLPESEATFALSDGGVTDADA
jgi:meiotic recombination protein DMC1